MIQVGIESGAQLIAFEKPVALTSTEGFEVRRLLEASGVKAVVSHQHRYGVHYQKVKVIASGALGRVHTVYGTRDRLDDAHAVPPDRLHALVSTAKRKPSG